jgi:hypothetical protein
LLAATVIFSSCDDDEEPKPIVLHVSAEAYSTAAKDFVATTATLTVTGDGVELFKGELPADFSDLEIQEGLTTYHVKIEKANYDTFEADYTEEQLEQPHQVRLYLTLTNGLAAWYPFTGSANDESGNELNGTLVLQPALTADKHGTPNSAYNFNGENYISIPEATLKYNTYTYSIWINVATAPGIGGSGNVFSIGSVSTTKHQSINISNKYASAEATGLCVGGWNNGATLNSGVTTDNLPRLNEWYHIVMVRSASAITMYVNNQYIGQSSTGGSPPLYENDLVANIGMRCNYTQGFVGKIDEFRIYDRVLSEEEIGNLFHKY